MDYFFYNTDSGALTEQPRPRFRVLIDQGFAAVGGDRKKYGEQFAQLTPGDVLLMYENRIGVVAVGRVREPWDGVTHEAPGYYKPAEMSNLTGGPHEYRVAVEWFLDLSHTPVSVKELHQRLGYQTREAVDRIVKYRIEVARVIEERQSGLSLLPGEISRPSLYVEGAVIRLDVDAYERSLAAVSRCKAEKGTVCVVCGFDFGAIYGAEFEGFIHVHHLKPLSEAGGEHIVDPIADLCPVCPNCHAVIHHGGRLRSVDEVQELLRNQKFP